MGGRDGGGIGKKECKDGGKEEAALTPRATDRQLEVRQTGEAVTGVRMICLDEGSGARMTASRRRGRLAEGAAINLAAYEAARTPLLKRRRRHATRTAMSEYGDYL